MNNPFDTIDARLSNIENILLDLKYSSKDDQPGTATDELVTRKQAAVLLGISLPTLHEYCKSGIIPSYRVGSRIRFKKSELLECLKKVKTIKFRPE